MLGWLLFQRSTESAMPGTHDQNVRVTLPVGGAELLLADVEPPLQAASTRVAAAAPTASRSLPRDRTVRPALRIEDVMCCLLLSSPPRRRTVWAGLFGSAPKWGGPDFSSPIGSDQWEVWERAQTPRSGSYDAGVATSDRRGPAPGRRPTIEDVARLADVSRGTVSRVLNGGRNVRPAVFDAVNAAIDALGYSVNQAARNLARGHTGSIAFVISDREESLFEDPNFGMFVRVFSRQLRQNGRHLLLTMAQDEEEENFLGDYLTLGHVDGALLALTHEREPLLGRLLSNHLPLVVLGKPLGFEDAFSWVAIDDEKAAFTVVSYLAGRVGGPIGTVTGPMHTSSGRERFEGYRRAIGDQFRTGLVAAGDWSLRSGRLGAQQLLDRNP